MSDRLFDDVVRTPSARGGGVLRSILFSVITHAAAIVLLVIVPLAATGTLPKPRSMLTFVVPPMPPAPVAPAPAPPPPRTVRPRAATTPRPVVTPPQPRVAPVPTSAPTGIAPAAPSAPPAPPTFSVASTVEGALPTFAGTGASIALPGPPPVVAAPIRVGGQIREPHKVVYVSPVYPEFARAAKVSGQVVVDAVIGPDGRVRQVNVRKSVPMLDRAALDAVQKWQFTPTLLNGVPVSVILTVTVVFELK